MSGSTYSFFEAIPIVLIDISSSPSLGNDNAALKHLIDLLDSLRFSFDRAAARCFHSSTLFVRSVCIAPNVFTGIVFVTEFPMSVTSSGDVRRLYPVMRWEIS
jgi:hypothetical protein